MSANYGAMQKQSGQVSGKEQDISQARKLEREESSSGSLPLVIKKNGELFVSDGHHRLTKLASEGEQNARVRLIDFDEPTDTPLLNYNPNQSTEDDAVIRRQLFGVLPKDA